MADPTKELNIKLGGLEKHLIKLGKASDKTIADLQLLSKAFNDSGKTADYLIGRLEGSGVSYQSAKKTVDTYMKSIIFFIFFRSPDTNYSICSCT